MLTDFGHDILHPDYYYQSVKRRACNGPKLNAESISLEFVISSFTYSRLK
jgi:hypothetical protein